MIQTLLLDFDGVLRIWDPSIMSHAEQAAGLPAGALRSAAFAPELLSAAVTGQISDGEWRRQIGLDLGKRFPGAKAGAAVRLWSEPAGEVDRAVLALAERCREKIRLVLITNATSRLPSDLARLGLGDAFDAVINSSVVGAAKPDAAIYRAALQAAGTPASATLFVDDTPGHVEAATRLGIVGHLYQGVERLAATLHGYGLVSERSTKTRE